MRTQFTDNEITFTAWVKIPSNHIGNEYSTIIGGRSGFDLRFGLEVILIMEQLD